METLLNWLWQGGAIALALSVVLHGLRRVPATTRYIVCWLAKLAVVTVPVWAAAGTSAPVALPMGMDAPVISVPDAWWTSAGLLMIGWAAWASVAAATVIHALMAIARLRHGASAFPESLESRLGHWLRVSHAGRRAGLTVSPRLGSAATLAGRPPMIVVAPSLLSDLEVEDLDRVLVHEWAHVQRRDDLSCVVESILRIVVGWHPAIWWIDRRLHVEREVACDEMVVAITGAPKQYAACLVTLANLRAAIPGVMALSVVRPSHLRERVVRLVRRPRRLRPMRERGVTVAASAALVVTTALLSQLTLVDAAAMALPPHPVPRLHMPSSLVPVVPSSESLEVLKIRVRSTASLSQNNAAALVTPRERQPVQEFSPVHHESVPSAKMPAASRDRSSVPVAAAVPIPQPQVAPQPPPNAGDPTDPPWVAVADRGVELGNASRAAGVRTANAFSRFGRRIAAAF